jgi:hypothetical protein
MKVILVKNKTTANTIRYGEVTEAGAPVEDHPKQLYLTKTEVNALGNPEVLDVTIAKHS